MARMRNENNVDDRKIAVYARKSKITETGKSIEIQKEKCISLACAQFDVAEEDILIYEDEGKSGFYADRPQYKRMLRDIENNKIKAVICYKIDRISRRTVDLLNLVQQMDQKGISFISVSDRELDTSSRTGKIMISLLSAIAEFERDIIAERISDNMYELALVIKSQEIERELNVLKKRLTQIDIDIQSQTVNLRTAPNSVKQIIYSDIEGLNKERDEKQDKIDKIFEDSKSQDSQIADIEKAGQTIIYPKGQFHKNRQKKSCRVSGSCRV